jgi:adenosine kinase
VSAFPKENGSRPRIVVFTQGKDPTVVASFGKVSAHLIVLRQHACKAADSR